ncbi:MAG TPA: rod shape-determining protein MreC [Limnochordales bacterium]
MSLAYLTARVRTQRTVPEEWLLDALAPARHAVASVARRVEEQAAAVLELGRLRRENAALREELEQLRLRLQLLERASLENRWLRDALQLPPPAAARPVAAEVIERHPSRWYAQVLINRGRDDGVGPDAPVVTGAGVVGYVAAATAHTATVRLLTDVEASAGGLVERTGDLVLVEGTGHPSRMRVRSLTGQASFGPGDRVVTSGLGGLYPRGLLLGFVESVRPVPGGLGMEGWLRPAADLGRLWVVWVLQGRSGEGALP